jgi:hypothetical protein
MKAAFEQPEEFYHQVEFDKPKLERLKKLCNQAVASKKIVFEFDGREYVTDYAKYLIEFLTPKFK